MIEKCNKLNIKEERAISDEYAEVVFFSKDIDQWNKILSEILGPAAKPEGREPTKEDLDLTKDYGGVYDNQTLFRRELDGVLVIAMFWPWQDNVHTTLKIACLKK